MRVLKYIKKLIEKIIFKFIKEKKSSSHKIITIDKYVDNRFTKEQQAVITECMALGLDASKIAKKKYSAEQMKILMFGLILDLDIKTFESYSMTPLEMETNLFIEASNKYLGKDYLMKLINSSNGSLEDEYIKRKLDSDLMKKLSEEFKESIVVPEIASTTRTEEDDIYDTLIDMCKARGLDYTKISKDTISVMIYNYDKLEKNLIDTIIDECIPLITINNYMVEPSAYNILTKDDIEFRKTPVTLWIGDKLITKDYRILRDGRHSYLYNSKLKPIKLR